MNKEEIIEVLSIKVDEGPLGFRKAYGGNEFVVSDFE